MAKLDGHRKTLISGVCRKNTEKTEKTHENPLFETECQSVFSVFSVFLGHPHTRAILILERVSTVPSINYDILRRAVTLEEVMMLVGYRLNTMIGCTGRGPCPFRCSPDARCCSIDFRMKCWKCHRCNKCGGVLDFYAAFSGRELFTSCLDLCRRMRIDVPYVERSTIRSVRSPRIRARTVDADDSQDVDSRG